MLMRQTLLYLPAQFLAPLIQFATVLVWAHILPTDQVGIATLAVAIQDISFALFYMWWSQFALRHLARFRAGTDLHPFLATEPVALGVSALVQVVVLAPLLGLYFAGSMSPALLAAMLGYLVTRALNLCLAERARADGKIRLYTIMQVGAPAIGLVAGFAFVHAFGATATSVLAAFALAQGLSLLLALVDSDFARTRPHPYVSMLRQSLSFGVPIMAASLMSVVALNAPRFIVDQTLGLAAAGMFAVAYSLGLRTSSFASMMVTAGAYPLVIKRFEAEGMEAAYAQLRRNTTLLVAVIMPAALGLIAVNASMVKVLLPVEFGSTAMIVLPLAACCGLLRDLRSHSTNQVFLLHGKTRYTSLISFIDLGLALLLSIIGIRIWGVPGAVFGPLAAAVAALVASVSLAVFRFGFRLPMGEMLRVVAAAAAMALLVWLLPDTGNLFILLAEIGLGAALYSGLLFLLLPVIRQELKAMLARRAKPQTLAEPSP
jgi:O-antigen/teichoic acid export membrane protein